MGIRTNSTFVTRLKPRFKNVPPLPTFLKSILVLKTEYCLKLMHSFITDLS